MTRPPEIIFAEIEREQEKLAQMNMRDPATLQQSRIVDELINEYYQSLVYHENQQAS